MTPWLQPTRLLCPWDSLGKNTGVGCHALLQGIFPTQGSNPGLSHCRQILYCLSHQESPWILEWVACPFSRGSLQPNNWTRVSCIAGGFFTSWATREAWCLNEEILIIRLPFLVTFHFISSKSWFLSKDSLFCMNTFCAFSFGPLSPRYPRTQLGSS